MDTTLVAKDSPQCASLAAPATETLRLVIEGNVIDGNLQSGHAYINRPIRGHEFTNYIYHINFLDHTFGLLDINGCS